MILQPRSFSEEAAAHNLRLPDFQNSVVNLSATLAEFLGAPNQNPVLPVLRAELSKGYRRVVFFCFDGLGCFPLRANRDAAEFLLENLRQTLTSTFPSTTTNATRSLLTNQLPLEHGWFGWSMHSTSLHRNVDIFLNRDSVTREPVEWGHIPLDTSDYFFDQARSRYAVSTVFPSYVRVKHPERNRPFQNADMFWSAVEACCREPGSQFVYAYFPEPDSTMHRHGVASPQAKRVIKEIARRVQALWEQMEDTLFVISADHGQIDVTGYVPLHEDQDLLDLLEIDPFMEARAPAFLVKPGREQAFEQYFREQYGADFLLFRSAELVEHGLFGPGGDKAPLLGDYLAVGTYTHKQALLTPNTTRFRGHHTSLTEEMDVPLIMLGK